MSTDIQELLGICEQLPQAKRIEVTAFARLLLAQNRGVEPHIQAAQRWLTGARGAAIPGTTTDQIMALTRGEP